MRPDDGERARVEVTGRIVNRHLARAGNQPVAYLETLINDTLYHERQRLERESKRDPVVAEQTAFYGSVQRKLGSCSETELRRMLEEMTSRFVVEVIGNFSERVYKLATSVVPTGLAALLNTMSTDRLTHLGSLSRGVSDHIEVKGEVDHARGLLEHGTLMVVPTHSSHLDSIVLGYAAHLIGLPPLLYGAGLNLFTNPMLSFFMNNLGAYRVDRKKKAPLYKEVLKEYATVAMEMGYHNLFFPGGTRSRSGAVERHLKRGLLGTALSAYVNNLRSGRSERERMFIVPCSISYALVLEAETLIDDHLKETGRARYIIDDDESTRPRRVLNFMRGLTSLDGRIVLSFSAPLDPFGNPVDERGVSLDPRGRAVDPASYVSREGEPVIDEQRDREYTTQLAEAVADGFAEHNEIMASHVVAYALFHLLATTNPEMDLYRLLRTGGKLASLPVADVARETTRVLGALEHLHPRPRLSGELRLRRGADIVDRAMRYYGCYHTRPPAERRGDRIVHVERNLLLYYSNRLRGYGLGKQLDGGARSLAESEARI